MGKSNYPTRLDTSVELPAARDSTLAEHINSLRSAVIQIERTLGVNPQGSVGNTVASRLNQVIDSNGNLIESALTQIGLLTGPITNSEVSEHAAIKESKLDLNFPTQILQTQLSSINSEISDIDTLLEEVSSLLSTHLASAATNRHKATAISIEPTDASSSATATMDLESNDVQEALEVIYNQHINFSGADISSENNSHLASQIYFDNSSLSISADNVQEAIEAVSTSTVDERSDHQNIQHSNGKLRLGNLSSPSDSDLSEVLATGISVSFSTSAGSSEGTTTLSLNDEVDITNFDLRKFDLIKIEDPNDTTSLYSGVYEIKSFISSSNILSSIEIFGLLISDSTSDTVISIGKSIERTTNEAGLLVTQIEEPALTSSRYLQIANPDAVRIISSNISPTAISTTNRYLILNIDDKSYTLDVYTSSIDKQSIDSIIVKINETLAGNAANALAYRLDKELGGSELVICHNIPDSASETHTLTVSRGADDAIDALGFGDIESIEQKSLYGTKYFINGEVYSGLKEKLNSTELIFFSSSLNIGIGNSTIDFLSLGIRDGDLIIISDAADVNDNGSYYIDNVTSSQIRILSDQKPSGFNADSGSNATFRIYSNIISLEDITFDSVGSSFGSTILDIFIDRNQDVFYSKTLEYQSVVVNSTSLVDIVDVDGIDLYNKTMILNFDEDPDDASAFLISLGNSETISISGTNKYLWITSHDYNIKLKVYIADASSIVSKINSDGTGFDISVYLFEPINSESNLFLARTLYNNFNGRIAGGINGPRFKSKLSLGNLSSKDISSEAKYELIEKPFSELRYNGVIYGFEIENVTTNNSNEYVFDIRRGLAYINGRRILRDTITDFNSGIDADSVDKIYIVLDEDGNVRADSALANNCVTPFAETDFCLLGSIEYDGSNLYNYDLRLFIDHLDLKLLNSISVSPQKGLGHFTDPVKALKYAKRFAEIFPLAGVPTVHFKAGNHKIEVDYTYNEASTTWDPDSASNRQVFYNKQIDEGFFIDFPVIIEGEGWNTSIELINNSTFTNVAYELTMPIIIVGPAFAAATKTHNTLGSGDFIVIRNIKLQNTRISCVDFNLTFNSAEKRYNVDIDNVYFNFFNFPGTFIDGTNGPRAVELLEVSNTSNNKGNLTINNCKFVKCGFYTSSASRTKNLTITNNIYIDPNDATNFLFNDIYSFSTVSSGANVNIVNNRYNSRFVANSGSGPQIVAGQTLEWGERFSRDIRVGNKGYFASTKVDTNYAYNTVQTKYMMYYADDLFWLSSGSGTLWGNSSSITFSSSTFTVGGNTVVFPYINIPTTGGRFRINPPLGSTVVGITFGYTNISAGTIVNINVYALNRTGGSSLLSTSPITSADTGTWTQSGAVSASNIGSEDVTVSIAVDNYSHYLVQITHDDSSNNFRLYWIRLELEISNVEDAIGLE